MSSFANIIKQASLGVVEAGKPVWIQTGTVSKIHPLEVSVEQRFTLPEDFLIVTEQLTELKLVIGGIEHTIRRGLEVGDKVLLLRMQGGLDYIILDRMVST
ncbi:DUF2577 domain-containing protein [Paenibacillus eucommiae]|uniref:DUF2577 domain-containing protein n=1 Tax=Paenibacillus eucommiae TaxID=1355755 RepID=A0ABS4ISV2_9BACL|nr:DUF2577 domain-containing protein [Paenibacillus eucommiae]MBP1990205.1 hypothetical protein [Paenibacillus eucommiae]